MTLNHSKTWPVATLAVVQLRVNPHGRTYSAVSEHEQISAPQPPPPPPPPPPLPPPPPASSLSEAAADDEGHHSAGGIVLSLSQNNLRMFTNITIQNKNHQQTIRTDTVSTILDQDSDFEGDHEDLNKKLKSQESFGKFKVLALARIEEETNNCSRLETGRRHSNKVDNWDYIYTETEQIKCPIHYNEKNTKKKEQIFPDLPLDARKTTTLRRHYYPEGGWGWVVVTCAVLVHCLNHGIQLAYSQLITTGITKFKVEAVHFSGKFLFYNYIYYRYISTNIH